MARPGFTNHWKFRSLCAFLGLPEPYALGLIEMVWLKCYESGDDVVGDRPALEQTARWTGEAGAFAHAVILSRLVDEDSSGICHVHDLRDHAPAYGKAKAARFDPRAVPLPTVLNSEAFRAAWDERLTERSQKGAKGKLCESQVKTQLRRLAKVAQARGIDAAVACVERATDGGHQGIVFPTDLAADSRWKRGRDGAAPGGHPAIDARAEALDRATFDPDPVKAQQAADEWRRLGGRTA